MSKEGAIPQILRLSYHMKQDGEQVSAWIATQPFNAFVFRASAGRQPYVFVVNEEKGIVEQRAKIV